jgi:hypothetical protein
MLVAITRLLVTLAAILAALRLPGQETRNFARNGLIPGVRMGADTCFHALLLHGASYSKCGGMLSQMSWIWSYSRG